MTRWITDEELDQRIKDETILANARQDHMGKYAHFMLAILTELKLAKAVVYQGRWKHEHHPPGESCNYICEAVIAYDAARRKAGEGEYEKPSN